MKTTAWVKSSYSVRRGECVEVAKLAGAQRAVRDSKAPSGPTLAFTTAQWSAFTASLRAGQFD